MTNRSFRARLVLVGAFAFAAADSAHAALYFTAVQEGTGTSGDPAWGNLADYPTADLTTLGTTDWVMFGVSGTNPAITNSKAGGTALSVPTSSRTGFTGSKALFDHSSAVAHFSYTDGESPASASNVDAGLGAQRDTTWDNVTPFPRFDLSVPVTAAESTLYLWVVNSDSSVSVSGLSGATVVGTPLTFSSNNSSNGRLLKITFGGADAPENLTVRVLMTSGGQDHAYLGVGGAALSVVPEPAALSILGVALPTILRRRRA